ncbi:MAG: GTPase [Candidatus Competibacterales bacterium]|nr:GTPase [Candidatus Competibacterales bacterium]
MNPVRPRWWRRLGRQVLSPRIDDAELAARLERIRSGLPVPVIWLLGKPQSGKTSIVRALTGREDAAIGDGFRPCTRHSRLYDFPDATAPLVRFLDTRGLGEPDYRADEDVALHAGQAHLLMVVMNAMDPAQGPVLEALETIRRARPEWPLLLVQTTLHQGYPDPGFEHIRPYPYDQASWPPTVPDALARSLIAQRQRLGLPPERCVAVDLTRPEDGYEPPDYGLEALWAGLEQALPLGLRELLRGAERLDDLYARAAEPAILAHALTAGGLDLIPVPGVSLPLVLSVQARLCRTLAALYGQTLDARRWAEIGSALGAGYLVRLGGRQAFKLVPAYGPALVALTTGAATYALGKTLGYYFGTVRQGATPDPDALARVYAAEFTRGRERLRGRLRRS